MLTGKDGTDNVHTPIASIAEVVYIVPGDQFPDIISDIRYFENSYFFLKPYFPVEGVVV